MVLTCGIVCAIVVAGTTPPAGGEPDLRKRADLEVHFPTALAQADQTQPAELPVTHAVPPAAAFGDQGSWRWYVSGGYGREIDSSHDEFVIFGGGVSYFMADNLSLNFELNGLYIDQESESGVSDAHDAWGVNFNLLVRWHFLARERWSIYFDGGVGVMGTTERVPGPDREEPDGGTYFNFTPQAGFGGSLEVADNTRLLAGVRWHHISNAQTSHNNPGRDSLLVYAGVSFAF
ncbi:MAG: acyloxyacyl hydrolase [Planctomycetota bacterium]